MENVIGGIIFLSVAIWSYLSWQKHKSRDNLWMVLLSTSGFFFKLLSYFVEYFSSLPVEIKFVSSAISLAFYVFLLIIVVQVSFNYWKNKN
jgi:UDP-N-acetylmuramyl pentapeptide phosphotransferase/UDP-N-acetylglucosamine-1-phosphate transferase